MSYVGLAVVLLGLGLGAVVYAGVGLILVVVLVRERIGWRCPRCRHRTLELIWWLESYPTQSPAYFECTTCHTRLSRIRGRPWRDAGGHSFDRYYDGSTPGSINRRRKAVLNQAVMSSAPASALSSQARAHAGSASGPCPSI